MAELHRPQHRFSLAYLILRGCAVCGGRFRHFN